MKIQLLVIVLLTTLLSAVTCAAHYQVEKPIDLHQVASMLHQVQADNPKAWREEFEKNINQIYTGKGSVLVDISWQNHKLYIKGYVDSNGIAGIQTEDQQVFVIGQTYDGVRSYAYTEKSGAVQVNATGTKLYDLFRKSKNGCIT